MLVPSAWQLIKVHPFELSYYNELIGGPRGAWHAGFELAYWYDPFNAATLDELNRKLPPLAEVDYLNVKTEAMTFGELQSLGQLRSDIILGQLDRDRFPYVWLQTQDSKSSGFTRLLFAMTPWYGLAPRQLDGARVATVADPLAVSRAWALWLLTDSPRPMPTPARAPAWVRQFAPWLGRLWGEGLIYVRGTDPNEPLFDWAHSDPQGLLAAARTLADRHEPGNDPGARRLWAILNVEQSEERTTFIQQLFKGRPESLVDAVRIVIDHPDAVRTVLIRNAYTDTDTIGGPLDRDLDKRETSTTAP